MTKYYLYLGTDQNTQVYERRTGIARSIVETDSDVLMLNGNFAGRWGLLHGKTGIAVFLFHYARYSGQEAYAECAGELVEDILTQIDEGSVVDYAGGLSVSEWGWSIWCGSNY